MEEETRQKLEGQHKKEQIENAERKRQAPVDDSQMVDEMFGFIDTHSMGEGAAPTAFKVSLSFFTCLFHIDGRGCVPTFSFGYTILKIRVRFSFQ